jgi:hypothetical protein
VRNLFFDSELSEEHNGLGDLLSVRYNWPNLKELKMKKSAVALERQQQLGTLERIRRLAALRS